MKSCYLKQPCKKNNQNLPVRMLELAGAADFLKEDGNMTLTAFLALSPDWWGLGNMILFLGNFGNTEKKKQIKSSVENG